MKRLNVRLIKWFSNKLGFKIIMVRMGNGRIDIEGDKELLRYTDITGYSFKKEPLKREQKKL
jgi:hypothetical protein